MVNGENMIFRKGILLIFVFFSIVNAYSQDSVIVLWKKQIPGSVYSETYKEDTVFLKNGNIRIKKVSNPTLSVYFPSHETSCGTAVVICPGGGYVRLALDYEGYDVARWFAEQGVVAAVLKYRLPNDTVMTNKSVGPLQDVQEAIRVLRRNAEKWNINPAKTGVMGFSAGGHLAASASTLFGERVYEPEDNVSATPSFSLLIYPVISMNDSITHPGSRKALLGENPDNVTIDKFSCDMQVKDDTPPAFLVHALDDKSVVPLNSILYFKALQEHGIETELHLYPKGGHGFGMANNMKKELNWTDTCLEWLKKNEFLK